MGYGRNSFVGWGQESTWGTAVAPIKYAEVLSDEVRGVRNRVPRPVFRSLHAREGNLYDALFGGGGSFGIEANYIGMLRLLEHLFGDASVVTTNPDVGVRWVHTFTMKDGLMVGKGLTVHMNTDTDPGATPQKRVSGFKLNQATLSYAPDRNTSLVLEGAGKEQDRVAVSTPTFPPATEYVAGHQMTCEIDDVARAVDSAEVVINNGMDLEKRVLGSKNIAEPVRGNEPASVSVTGTVTMDALEVDQTKFLAGTLFKLELLSQGAVLGTGNFRLDLTLLKCLLLEDPINVPGPGIVKSTLAFRALLPTSGEILTAAVHNNESAVA